MVTQVKPSTLANTAVTPGSYTHASVTIDAQGRITAASSGTSIQGLTLDATANAPTTTGAASAPGFLDTPQNAQSTNYTLALTDRGKHIYYTGAAGTITVPTNATVGFPIGTTIVIYNQGSGVVTVGTTGISMYLAGTGTTGNRSVAIYGMATLLKIASDTWVINGNGVT